MAVKLSIENKQKQVAVTKELRALWRQALKQTIITTGILSVKDNIEVSLVLTDDAEIHQLNVAYRNQNKATDVLSFPMQDDFDHLIAGMDIVLGDIVISLERAVVQSEEYGHSVTREAVFLFTHGVLHLLGYDHELGADEEKEMFDLQEQILTEIGLTR